MTSHEPPALPLRASVSRWHPSGDAAWQLFAALAAVLLPVMILASFDFGVTWDEKSRHRYGEFIWEFFRGTRSRSQFGETGGHLYGGFFDFICAGLEQWIPANRYVIRHVVNAIFGWVGIVYCGRLAAHLFGRWAGVLALALLAASPRYFADSMNNPKDVPFAALSVVALYYISTVSPRWPYLSWSTTAKIAVALALALNVRVGALLYAGYLGLLLLALVVLERDFTPRRLVVPAARLAVLMVAVLLLGTLVWPWAQGAPFWRPFRALFGVANFGYTGLVLFGGREYAAGTLPWYYGPWWILISTPPAVLAGLALSVMCVANRTDALRRAALWAVALFPIVVAIAMQSTLYDGIRHLLFTYPIFVALSSAGWVAVIERGAVVWRRLAAGALAAGLASMVIFQVRFHPNQTVYFNALVSGPRGAFAKYDMDYWGNCVLGAVKWTAQQARLFGMPVTVSGNPWHLVQLDAERFHELSFTYPARARHYFHVRLARGPIAGVTELAAQPALHQITTADGVVLCNVVPGPAYGELQALLQSHMPTQRAPQP